MNKPLPLLVLVLVMAGCAAPPERVVAEARASEQGAKAAGAERYALREMHDATAKMNEAEAEIVEQGKKFAASRNYKRAMEKFQEAKAGFEEAAAVSKRRGRADLGLSQTYGTQAGDLEYRVQRIENWLNSNVKNW